MPRLLRQPHIHLLLAPFLCIGLCADLFADQHGQLERASEGSGNVQGNDASGTGSPTLIAMSEDGRYTAFTSFATNLVPGDTNGEKDVFLRDSATDQTVRASVGETGIQSNGRCDSVGVSADGRFVVYRSEASNLSSFDINGRRDIFLFDRTLGTSRLISKRPDGLAGNDGSESPSISADGRYVCFWSSASDLVAGDTNGEGDIFLWDAQTDLIQRVSTDTFGNQGNGRCGRSALARGGRYVAFESESTNLALGDLNGLQDVFWKDTATNQIFKLTGGATQLNGISRAPSLSGDGRFVAFESDATNLVPGDTNGFTDIFMWDAAGGGMVRMSLDSAGAQPNGHSGRPHVSADGQWIAYESLATNLVPGDGNGREDVFLWSRLHQWTERVSVRANGSEISSTSNHPHVSGDGRYVGFLSPGAFIPADSNDAHDVFVRDRGISSSNLGYGYCDSNPNSSGQEATMRALESPVIADNDLLFVIDDLPANQLGYMLMSDSQGFVSLFGGSQGNLCLGGNILRFSQSVLDTESGSVDFEPDLTALPQGTAVLPGQGWNFQFWFRDGNPNSTSNTSGGLCVTLR